MAQDSSSRKASRPVCVNRKARHDYEVLETVEAGIVLTGAEVKSLRAGQGQLADAYAAISAGQVTLKGLEIPRYAYDHAEDVQTRRGRRLLLHKRQIDKLAARVRERGLSLVPLSIYFSGPWAKVELAVVKGRRKADKRQALKAKEAERDMDRATRRR